MTLKADSQYDSTQVLPRVYDNDKGVLRVWPCDGENGLVVNPDGSINVAITTPQTFTLIEENATDTLPDSSQKVCFTYTSTDNNSYADTLNITASAEVLVVVKVNGDIKRQARTSPGNRNVTVEFTNARNLLSGDTLTVELKITNVYNSLPVDTFVSLEGRIT